LLTQTNAPLLWQIFQTLAGCAKDKKDLYSSFAVGKKTILEIGCSLGNTALAFADLSGVQYTGLDIDPVVIEYAKKKYKNRTNMQFICEDLRMFARSGHQYDLVIFAGVLHHIPDELSVEMLASSRALAEGGDLVVVEPLRTADDRGWYGFYLKYMEKGEHVRTVAEMHELFQRASLDVLNERVAILRAWILPEPKVARFGAFVLASR
jgi:2-polyprenyl-3-methyl-5-hydroxy-6-metoxy-1,4-benzoquinol methylase